MGEVYRARDSRPRSRGRDQGAAAVDRLGHVDDPALRARGQVGRRALARQHPGDPRLRHGRRPRLRRDRATRGGHASRAAARGRARRSQGGRGSECRSRAASAAAHAKGSFTRPQARERDHHPRRPGQDPRFRTRGARGTTLRRRSESDETLAATPTRTEPGPTREPCWARRATCPRSRSAARRPTRARTSSLFGALLYEMLTAKRAFVRKTPAETMTAILRDEPEEPSASGSRSRRRFGASSGAAWRSTRRSASAPPRTSPSRSRRRCKPRRSTRASRAASSSTCRDGAHPGSFRSSPPSRWPSSVSSPDARWPPEGAPGERPRLRRNCASSPSTPIRSRCRRSVRTARRSPSSGATIPTDLCPAGRRRDAAQPDAGRDRWLQPSFSPDGESIAYVSSAGGVFVMGATGESARRVTDAGFNPSWSPDGTRLLVNDERIFIPGRD